MTNTNENLIQLALGHLLGELIDGPAPQWLWVLDRKSPGLLKSLSTLSATAASTRPTSAQSSIAAHVDHLRFSFSLFNRWANGEENPFATADWSASWQNQAVNDEQWREILNQLEQEAHGWLNAAQQPREWEEITLTGAIASIAHMAYHMGAIRQLIVTIESDRTG